jgi:acyl-CoA synthetase (NDP forming)
MKESDEFECIFNPRYVAIIGASEHEDDFTIPMLKSKIKDKLFLVNPRYEKVFDVKCFPSILDIEQEIDYAIIGAPAPVVPQILKECIKKGVKVAHIYSSGFSETGIKERIELENEIKEIAKGKIRLIGPNCMGIYCSESGLTFSAEAPTEEGPVGVVSQSGTFGFELLRIGPIANIKFSKMVSYGNALDLDCSDFLGYLADDPKTKIVALYIEGTKNGERLKKSLEKVVSRKPVVALKGGVTEHGSRAAFSHTGSLAGSPNLWKALFKQLGIIQVETLDELTDTILALLYSPVPKDENVSIITSSGGFSVIETDQCMKMGLKVPQFRDKTMEELRKLVPIAGTSIRNPLDAWPIFHSGSLLGAVKIVGFDENINSVILHIGDFSRFFRHREDASKEVSKKFVEDLLDACKYVRDELKKPVMLCADPPHPISLETEAIEAMGNHIEAQTAFQNEGFPIYPSIQRAAKAIYHLYTYRGMKLRNGG